jgi:hypothetical protein
MRINILPGQSNYISKSGQNETFTLHLSAFLHHLTFDNLITAESASKADTPARIVITAHKG